MFRRRPLFKPALTTLAALGLFGGAQAATPVFINEIHYDNTGTDSGEAVEIAGPAGTDLSGWSLVLYNGNGGANYRTATLSGVIADQSGSGFGTLSFGFPTDGIQNGAPDGIALVDANQVAVQFLSYEGTFNAVGGPAAGQAGTDIGVSESSATPVGFSLQLQGSGQVYEDFLWASASDDNFGAVNAGQSFAAAPPDSTDKCRDPATAISAIQGNDIDSPLVGTRQTVEAIVTADFSGGAKLNGFFVQQADGETDADPTSSEGLFIAASASIHVGDRVRISGNVAETYGMTRLENVSPPQVCASGQALPAAVAVELPFGPDNRQESREGMLVTLPQTLTVTENYNLARYGEFLLSSGGRLLTPTQAAEPGAPALAIAAQNLANQLLVDDGANLQNPDPVIYPEPAGLSGANTLRVGDSVSGATGILAYDFGAYRLQPTQTLTLNADNPRDQAPTPDRRTSLTVASFNVLNYFNGDGNGGGFPTARGADSPAEFAKQRAKIVAALTRLNADVIGLMEIENDGYAANSAIADLVAGLNQAAGPGTYAYINPGVSPVGSDEIAVGLIYKPAKASPIGPAAILSSAFDPAFIDTKNRPTIAQTFRDKTSNKLLTVAVNHLKSKGSACDDVNDPDTGDGQGNCNLTRTAAAQVLTQWLATDPTHAGSANALIVGDLNSYAEEDPISALKSAGYRNLLENLVGNHAAYSYVFDGASGYLDHALANTALAPQVKAVSEWHINADEPRALDYNEEFKSAGQIADFYAADAYRSSDHDPLLVQLFVAGDLDSDGDVDSTDAAAAKAQIGQCASRQTFNREADYDNNGCVSYTDYRTWYGHYQRYQTAATGL
ncbi:ExeM/NucH family extracellular endonuclease [Methylomonas sp. MS20]|uniref:ExeM/NucH family extracellular endonuclease n=1 Tax=unclassified Methylomonas TaxID=2608980 RepID=UPI0028A4C5E8|nr:ExeM/NucH family extracellular endonuclease [Methylomonas sp. MV1]MDT4329627.1 ExeM/NucH family extracellular endonuclease [Methylomonas sp. MV1]